MRFQVMYKKSAQPKEAYLPFFESDDIAEIKDFAMRLASSRATTSMCRTRLSARSSATSRTRVIEIRYELSAPADRGRGCFLPSGPY